MTIESWNIERWEGIAALLFTGLAFCADAMTRRGQTLIEITKQHRELWIYFGDHPEFAGLFDPSRDLEARPLTDAETRFANFLFLHFRASYGAKVAWIHVLPEHVEDDWREIFTNPAVVAAWEKMKHLHDCKFVAIVEDFRKRDRPIEREYRASPKRASTSGF